MFASRSRHSLPSSPARALLRAALLRAALPLAALLSLAEPQPALAAEPAAKPPAKPPAGKASARPAQSPAAPAAAPNAPPRDVVVTKSGSIINGWVTRYVPTGYVIVKTETASVTVAASEVLSVAFADRGPESGSEVAIRMLEEGERASAAAAPAAAAPAAATAVKALAAST